MRDRPASLIERTAVALSKRLEAAGDGSEDNSQATVLRALHFLLDTLEEDILEDWEECLLGPARINLPSRFSAALDWEREHQPSAGP